MKNVLEKYIVSKVKLYAISSVHPCWLQKYYSVIAKKTPGLCQASTYEMKRPKFPIFLSCTIALNTIQDAPCRIKCNETITLPLKYSFIWEFSWKCWCFLKTKNFSTGFFFFCAAEKGNILLLAWNTGHRSLQFSYVFSTKTDIGPTRWWIEMRHPPIILRDPLTTWLLEVTWQIKSKTSPLLQCLLPPNLEES